MTYPENTTYVHWLEAQHGQLNLLALLDKTEQQRAATYKFDRHRNLYIAAHVFLRKVLSYHATLPPEDWRFYQNEFGKPYIDNPGFKSIQFNLSHTQGMIVCAVNKTHEVGVDVEGPRPLKYIKEMSQRNYTEREYNDIFSQGTDEKRQQRFYTYWTLKESLIKAIGCGLSMPLKKIGFTQLENNSWTLESHLKSQCEQLNKNFTFNNKKMPNNYQISVSTMSDIKKQNTTKLCFIDSNKENNINWKKHIVIN